MSNLKDEDRMGCFSEADTNQLFVKAPMCPKCGSRDYQALSAEVINKVGQNCQCAECGWRYNFDLSY